MSLSNFVKKNDRKILLSTGRIHGAQFAICLADHAALVIGGLLVVLVDIFLAQERADFSANVAGGRPQQLRNVVMSRILLAIYPSIGAFVAENRFGQGAHGFGFTNPSGSHEHHGQEGTFWVMDPSDEAAEAV